MFSSLRFGLEFDKAWKNSFGTSKNDVMRSDNGPHHGESDDTANSEDTDQRGYGGRRDWGDADEERDQGRSQVDYGENRHDHPTKEKIFLFLDGSDDEKDAGNDIDNG
jgi:hypothetical protein